MRQRPAMMNFAATHNAPVCNRPLPSNGLMHRSATATIAASNCPVPLSGAATILTAAVAVIGYIVAFALPYGAAALLIALPAICLLGRQPSALRAFGVGLLVGLAICDSLLVFLYTLFSSFAAVLWLIGALPFAIFVLLLNRTHYRLGTTWAMWLTPVLWTGTEYFRSEVWPLRFAWLLPGQAAALLPGVRCAAIGVYGLGFVYVLLAALTLAKRKWSRVVGIIGLVIAAVLMYLPSLPPTPTAATLHVAGIQTEHWDPTRIAQALGELAEAHPEAQLLVLSELAFADGPVPEEVREVVRRHRRYLIAGGVVPIDERSDYNMAFVIGPDGSDLFCQAKSVPVQFLEGCRPAADRQVWESPWGKIGIAICYDACYSRVMDDFVRHGACGLIIPTMDERSWGEFERTMLHGRVQPIRSAEYGIPTFGVWSSGVSQLTDRYGRVVATAGYPGPGDTIAGSFDLSREGHIPPDRILAQASSVLTLLVACYLAWRAFLVGNRSNRRRSNLFPLGATVG
jgi:apolipoprotein N-acyltransferase